MVQVLHDTLRAEMLRNPAVVVMGQDVGIKGGVFKVTDGLHAEFGPMRVLDTPISEIVIAGAAIGAAMMGLRPVAEFQFADYMHAAYDQIVNQAATMRWRSVGAWSVPVVFRAPSGGGVHGGVYHSQSIEALYGHIPGLRVVVPATPRDAGGLLRAAIRDDDPVVFFEHKALYRRHREIVADDAEVVPLGLARLDREGGDVSVITYGMGVHLAREILDLRTLSPFDREAVARTVARTGKVLLVHEANRTMGPAAEIAAFIAEELFTDLDGPILRIGAADCHLPYNGPEETAILPDAARVEEALRRLATH